MLFEARFFPAAAAPAAVSAAALLHLFTHYPFSNMFALSRAIDSHGSPMRRPLSATPPLASSPAATSAPHAPPPPPSSAAIKSNLFVDCPHALASSTFQFCFCAAFNSRRLRAALRGSACRDRSDAHQRLRAGVVFASDDGPSGGSHTVTTLGLLLLISR